MIIKMNGCALEAPQAPQSVFRMSEYKSTERGRNAPKWKARIDSAIIPAASVTALLASTPAHAASSLDGAFDPVKHLLISVADPICYLVFVWGCIEAMVGRPASGISRAKFAALGFIGINWIPVIMDAIRSAGPA